MVRKLGIFLENSMSQSLLQQLNPIKGYPIFTEKTDLVEQSNQSIIDKKILFASRCLGVIASAV